MSKDNFYSSYSKSNHGIENPKDIYDILGSPPDHRRSIIDCFLREILNGTLIDLDAVLGEMESPIEELLAGAIIITGIEDAGEVRVYPKYSHFVFGNGPDSLVLWPQHQIGEYRVDFYIELWDWYERSKRGKDFAAKIIVECDGHDFHEKTKEQAQKDKERDRVLQSCGYPVFRFTGAEIWKNPFQCAKTIYDYLDNKTKEMVDASK